MGVHAGIDITDGNTDPAQLIFSATDTHQTGFRLDQQIIGLHGLHGIVTAVSGNIAGNQLRIALAERFAGKARPGQRARDLAEQLGDSVKFYKIGLELMMAGGYFELLDWLVERDKRVFVDLKFFDVPATVGRAVARLANRGVTFATVHGNQSIMEAAAAAKGD